MCGFIADFNFTIHYRPGKVNIDAGTLSQMALDDIAYMELCTEVIPHEVLQTVVCSAKLQEEGTVNWMSALSGDPTTLHCFRVKFIFFCCYHLSQVAVSITIREL